MQNIKLRGRSAPDFSNSSKTRVKATTYDYIMNWLSSSGRIVTFGGFNGEHGASERARRLDRTAFLFCGQCNTGGLAV